MEQLKEKAIARILVFAILLTIAVWLIPSNIAESNAATKLNAPRISSNGTVTWDCVYLGNYPQSSDGKGGFKKDPIKWRVLSVSGNDAFLVADKNLDARAYNEEYTDITWEKSTVRSWLNGYGSNANQEGISYTSDNFINRAFTAEEQGAIYEKEVINEDNPTYGTEGGNNTKDKVFLLSLTEAKEPDYGFPNNNGSAKIREAKDTSYVIVRNEWTSSQNGAWWLRSSGTYPSFAASVGLSGFIYDYGRYVGYSSIAIRPALHLNLSSNLWKHAGTVRSDGKVNESGDGKEQGSTETEQ